MYRVVIVDDEEPVLESLTFIFDKYVTDFKLCGKARSGTEALDVIKAQAPDLVFMDIQMPGLNGIEVIKQLRPLFPKTVFILSTAYERFDIAQKAIRLGVFSYLVKPVSKNKILEELIKVKIQLDRDVEAKDYELEGFKKKIKKREKFQKDFLTSLMWKSPTIDEWTLFADLSLIKSDSAKIYIFVVDNDVNPSLKKEIYGKIVKKIEYKYNLISTQIGDKLITLFPEDRSLHRLTEDLKKIFFEITNVKIQMGIGSLKIYSKLSESYNEAYNQLSKNSMGEIKKDHDNEKISLIYRQISTAERENGKIIYNDFWTTIFNSYDFIVAKGKLVALYTLMLQRIDIALLRDNNFDIDPSEQIIPLNNMDDWISWSSFAIDRYYDLMEVVKNNTYPKILKLAIKFITEQFDKPIQLSSVAKECNVSASYLSRLFTEHMNKKFIDYVNQYRIDRAISLLKEEQVTIKEASFRVGYQDPNYFSRIFRKYMGVSPSSIERRFRNE